MPVFRFLPTVRRFELLLLVAVGLCALSGWLAYRTQLAGNLERARVLASQRLDALALSLEATLVRHESLPSLLALDPSLLALLRDPGDPQRIAAANAYLDAAQQGAQVAATFLVDAGGNTLAASNWRLPRSFVGHNYAFRPYFRAAMSKGLGRFYGVGATTGEPGYFIAAPVHDGENALGVVVLKIGLEHMEQALASGGDTLFLADADGVVFLSSHRRWRYRSLAPLSDSVAAHLAATRQYDNLPITPLADRSLLQRTSAPVRIVLDGEPAREHLVYARPVGSLGWQVVQLFDPGEARAAAFSLAWAVAFALAFLLGLGAHFLHRAQRREELRRIHAGLESRIARRTVDLTEKIAALERTEAILRQTRDAAVQAGKLAVLGQMSAGISHELNQPLAALQTLADNARSLLARGRHDEAAENLQMIGDLVTRAGRIVRQLRTFARKEGGTAQAVAVAAAVEQALLIVEPGRRAAAVRVGVADIEPGLCVCAVSGRLEQVLVNLLRNGLDAMRGHPDPMLEVSARRCGDRVEIRVRDHGPGLSQEARARMFEPFYTSKPVGEGLGLGLAISLAIAESHGGSLTAHNVAEGGAEFVLTLPAAGEPDAPCHP